MELIIIFFYIKEVLILLIDLLHNKDWVEFDLKLKVLSIFSFSFY